MQADMLLLLLLVQWQMGLLSRPPCMHAAHTTNALHSCC